ncbi:MAG TPA: phage tail protein [Symbiobacteriaceae bacterium]|nr:phage tail protein [Symbiobacteriaceae bacterium]
MKVGRMAALVMGAVLLLAVSFGSARATTGRPAARADKESYRIQLVVGKDVVAEFQEISGLESEVEVVEYSEGTDPTMHKRAGKAKYKNIILRRGLPANDTSLMEWYKKVLAGQTDRKSGSIIYLDREGQEVARYNFYEAWPCRWKAPELNASSDTYIIEEIEFVVEKVERA